MFSEFVELFTTAMLRCFLSEVRADVNFEEISKSLAALRPPFKNMQKAINRIASTAHSKDPGIWWTTA